MLPNFPDNRLELEEQFRTQEQCLDYLFGLRWPNGFICPKCGHQKAWSTNRDLHVCSKCRHNTSVTAGTIFHRTRKPLTWWFRAIWYITAHKHGGNALGLQRELGFGSYHTAWEWHHKIRKAMVAPDRNPLSGLVEVDETYVGGAKPGKRGRGAEGKVLVVVAVEDKGKEGFGRIRMETVPNASSKSLNAFVEKHIALGSQVRTDGWRGYSKLSDSGYEHIVNGGGDNDEAVGEDPSPLCHRVISLFKRSLLNPYQGTVHPDQLDRYLEEYTFKFNRRKANSRGLLFLRLLQTAVKIPPFPLKEIELGLREYMRGKSRARTKAHPNKNIFRPPDFSFLNALGDLPF